MEEIDLIRAADDRRTYQLGRIGSLRLSGWLMRSATAQAGAETLEFKRASWLSAAVYATNDHGRTVGTFEPRSMRGGGTLTWRDKEYSVRPAALLRQRFQLLAGERELASIAARGWWGWGARRPLSMTLLQHGSDPGLLLFVAYVVRTLADKASSDASGASVATNTGAYSG